MQLEILIAICTSVLTAIIIGVGAWVIRAIKNSWKKAANNHRLIYAKVECIDFGLCNMNGTAENRSISRAFKEKRDERWNQLKEEHAIQNEGLE